MTNQRRNDIAMDERLPGEVELQSIGLSFALGAGKNLSRTWQRELRTESESRFRAAVTRSSLEMTFSPPILIDAQWPAMNMQLGGITRDFTTGQTKVFLGAIHGVAEGLIDFSDDAKKEIQNLIVDGINGTSMAVVGYNPMLDRHIVSTLESVTEHFRTQPKQGTSEVQYSDFGRVRIDMNLVMKADFRHTENGAGLEVRRGTTIDVTLEGRGNMATLMVTRTNAERAAAAQIDTVTISSKGILVVVQGKPVAYLDRLRVERGGVVVVEQLRLEGVLGEAAGMESVIRRVASAMQWVSGGASIDSAMTMATQSAHTLPKIVPEAVRIQIEKTMTEAVRQMLRTHRNVIPEVDLEEAFLS